MEKMKIDEKQEIIDGAQAFADAMLSNDAKRVGEFMADDWMLLSERGLASKDYFLGFIESGALTHESFELVGDLNVRIYGQSAVTTARVRGVSYFHGKRMETDEFTSEQLYKIDGRWLSVLTHVTAANKEFLAMIGK